MKNVKDNHEFTYHDMTHTREHRGSVGLTAFWNEKDPKTRLKIVDILQHIVSA